MPEIVRCPECHRQLKVPDALLGKKVRCPSCKTTFQAAVEAPVEKPPPAAEPPPSARKKPAAPPPEEQYEEAPPPSRPAAPPPPEEPDFEEVPPEEPEEKGRRRLRRKKRRSLDSGAGWQKVRLGLTLVLIGIFVGIAAVMVYFVGFLLAGAIGSAATTTTTTTTTTSFGSETRTVGSSAGAGVLAIIVIILVIAMALASRGLTVAGYGFFMPVPRASGAKPFANATFVLGIVNTLLPIISCIILWVIVGAGIAGALGSGSTAMLKGAGVLVIILNILMAVLGLAEAFALLQFQRTVVSFLGAEGLAKSIMYLMFLLVVIIGLGLLMVVISMLAGALGPSAPLGLAIVGCGCIDTILMIGWFIWLIITLFFVRGTVSSHITD